MLENRSGGSLLENVADKRPKARTRDLRRRGWRWTKQRERAASLVASDYLSDKEIARAVGITERTLERWKTQPAFRDRVASLIDAFRRSVEGKTIADKEARMEAYYQRWIKLHSIVAERGTGEEMVDAPGGKTGYLTCVLRVIGYGDNAERIEEFAVDTGLLRELRELEKQAAIEAGHWKERMELDLKVAKGYVNISPDDWDDHEMKKNLEKKIILREK